MVVKIKDSHKLMSICTDIISKTRDWVWEVDEDDPLASSVLANEMRKRAERGD